MPKYDLKDLLENYYDAKGFTPPDIFEGVMNQNIIPNVLNAFDIYQTGRHFKVLVYLTFTSLTNYFLYFRPLSNMLKLESDMLERYGEESFNLTDSFEIDELIIDGLSNCSKLGITPSYSNLLEIMKKLSDSTLIYFFKNKVEIEKQLKL